MIGSVEPRKGTIPTKTILEALAELLVLVGAIGAILALALFVWALTIPF